MPNNNFQANINAIDPQQAANYPDPYFQSQDFQAAANFDRDEYADYGAVDHTNDGGNGASELPPGSEANRAIDIHPITQSYMIYHLKRAMPPPA